MARIRNQTVIYIFTNDSSQIRLDQSFIEDSIAKTNRFFGGLNPRTYRIFYTQGGMDPYNTLGPQVARSPLSPVQIIASELQAGCLVRS
jgi:hypothetical protein